jgi:hypothetical protein
MNSQSDLSSPPSVWEFLSRSGPEDGLHATRLNTNTGPKLTSGPDWVVQRSPTEGTFYRDAAEMERFASIVTDKLSFEGFVFHSMRSSRSLCAKEDFKMEVRPTPLLARSRIPPQPAPPPPPFPRFPRGGLGVPRGLRVNPLNAPPPQPVRPNPLAPRARPPPALLPPPYSASSARPTTRSTSKSSALSQWWKS